MPGRKFNTPTYRYGFNGKEKEDEIANTDGADLDFGARIYDARLGRWLSTDPNESIMKGLTPYRFGFNTPLRFSDDGEFEIDEATRKKYPKLDSYLKNIASEYASKPAEFKKVFKAYSQLSDKQILEILTYGKGPKIIVEVPSHPDIYGETPFKYKMDRDGKLVTDVNGNPLVEDKGVISIAKDIVDAFEEKKPIKNYINEASKKLIIEVTLFHEAVHYGDYQDGYVDEDRPNENGKIVSISELGKDFENAAYGSVIEVNNAVSYVEKNNYDNATVKQREFLLNQMKEIEKSIKEMTENPNNFKYFVPDKTKVNKSNNPAARFN